MIATLSTRNDNSILQPKEIENLDFVEIYIGGLMSELGHQQSKRLQSISSAFGGEADINFCSDVRLHIPFTRQSQ